MDMDMILTQSPFCFPISRSPESVTGKYFTLTVRLKAVLRRLGSGVADDKGQQRASNFE
jgi:hypothetical protein